MLNYLGQLKTRMEKTEGKRVRCVTSQRRRPVACSAFFFLTSGSSVCRRLYGISFLTPGCLTPGSRGFSLLSLFGNRTGFGISERLFRLPCRLGRIPECERC